MKIGLFGGTFDPIHRAHLELSNIILDKYQLDKIIFIPSGNSYFKKNVTDKYIRYEMVKLAINEYRDFEISDVETRREGNSYTYETIEELKLICPEDSFYWIQGSDTFLELKKWKNYDYLLMHTNFIVYMRPGDRITDVKELVNEFGEKYGTSIQIIERTPFEISSTEIRENIYRNDFNEEILPEGILEFIYDNNLYR